MSKIFRNKLFITVLLIGLGIAGYSFIFSEKIDYNTDVKPILNKKCISCHGGVKKKGGFSLLFQSEALAATESGKPAIIPGDPEGSEMIRRIKHHDPEERMPYKEDPLTEEEIEVLTKWIQQGAKWGNHWAYVSVKEQEPPTLKRRFLGILPSPYRDWVKNEVDYFILNKLEGKDLDPSPTADKRSLLRRASLDIIGMPAPEAIAESFLKDDSPEAFEKLVDTLLAHPGYGERWTSVWLDLARYADTKGYERDDVRKIWRYRDWLIKAFNEDKPYDVFLTEQIAGDLINNATDEQLIATAFHRNTMTNDEGGTDNEEFRTAAVLDRVNTTWEVLLGTTFACVQCHSHPYDPFRHEEYYKFMAFFNNTRDEDTFAEYPLLWEYKNADSLKFVNVSSWFKQNVSNSEANAVIHFLKTRQPAINSLTSDSFINSELADTKWLALRNFSSARFRDVELGGRTRFLMRMQSWVPDGTLTLHLDSLKGPVFCKFKVPLANKGWMLHEEDIMPVTGKHNIYLEYSSPSLKKDANGMMFDWLSFTTYLPGKDKPGYDSAVAGFFHLISRADAVTTPVMVENPDFMQRKTFVFERGNWTAKTEEVNPDVPASLNPLPKDAPKNRLGLAKWLTDKQNPLTSRAIVNRIWEQLFGTGLVETLEDLGTQGVMPTHPELLDYLAYQLMTEYKWSLKTLIKKVMMSATYQQDSRVSPEGLEKDKFNRYYARGPRVRLSAEQLRDQALAISGALYPLMYGPSSKPWQPEGIWNSPYSGGEKWENSLSADRYRRAVYTYWKRTSAYPSMLNFDAMQREVCTSRRIRTNTPLQALTLLNDQAYVDISRQFTFALQTSYKTVDACIAKAYEKALGRPASTETLSTLRELYNSSLEKFRKDPDATCEMAGLQDEHNVPETAALIVVVHSIMNLDELITKP